MGELLKFRSLSEAPEMHKDDIYKEYAEHAEARVKAANRAVFWSGVTLVFVTITLILTVLHLAAHWMAS